MGAFSLKKLVGIVSTCDVTVTLTTPVASASVTVTVPERNGLVNVEVTLLGQEIVLLNISLPYD
jgi:hypothetical protein